MLYLASTSPRRKAILKSLGFSFRTLKPNYKEGKTTNRLSPSRTVKKHALSKALSMTKKVRNGVIIGADTVVYFRGRIIGKPKNFKEAVKILRTLEGCTHTVHTGVALLEIRRSAVKRKAVFSEKTRVRLKEMSSRDIEDYFRKIDPLDKAGAYAIQSKTASIVREIRGSYSNAVGLPVEKLCVRLKNPK